MYHQGFAAVSSSNPYFQQLLDMRFMAAMSTYERAPFSRLSRSAWTTSSTRIEPYELYNIFQFVVFGVKRSYDTHMIYILSESVTSRLIVVDILSHAAPHIIRLIVRYGMTPSLE